MEIARNDSRSVSELWFDGDEITLISYLASSAPLYRTWYPHVLLSYISRQIFGETERHYKNSVILFNKKENKMDVTVVGSCNTDLIRSEQNV